MRFSFASLALLVAASSATAAPPLEARALTAAQVVDNINQITQLSQNLQPIVAQIPTGGTILGKRQFRNPFQPVISGFFNIIRVAQDSIDNMGGTPVFPAAEATLVCDAFREFVIVHQALLNIVIGKSGVLQGIFLGPVASVLRGVEAVVDTLAFGIIDAVPTCRAQATMDKQNLDATLDDAICAYTPGGSLGVNLFC